jgi:DNA-binding response OmpR family regulator
VGQLVFIVEDDDELRRMFRHALALSGFDTQEARDGYHALHLLDQHKPDAIVLDLGLPRVSGYVVLQEVLAQAHLREIPVIVATGMPDASEPEGAACFLRKPVTPDRLVRSVRDCIALAGARAQTMGYGPGRRSGPTVSFVSSPGPVRRATTGSGLDRQGAGAPLVRAHDSDKAGSRRPSRAPRRCRQTDNDR